MINWKRLHRYEKKAGWCGPAVIQMILLAAGIKKSQEEIEEEVNLPWWGTTQDITIAYLSRYFETVGFKAGTSVGELKAHLDKGHVVILDWWDDLSAGEPDGHYSIAADYDIKNGKLTLVDPSRLRHGIWDIKFKDFEKKWFDTLDVRHNLKLKRFIIWVDPQSRIDN